MDSAGFEAASSLALERGDITAEQKSTLFIKFWLKEAETMGREKQLGLAEQCYKEAVELDQDVAATILKEFGFEDRAWVK